MSDSHQPHSTAAATADQPPQWVPVPPPWLPAAEPQSPGRSGAGADADTWSPPTIPSGGWASEDPWSPGWSSPTGPTRPGGPDGPGGWPPSGGWPPPGGWQPPGGPDGWPTPPAPPTQPPRSRFAAVVAAMLIAALIGAGIGSRLQRTASVASSADAPFTPSAPSTVPGGASSSSSPATGTAARASAIAAKVDPAIVDINTQLGYQNGAGAGTGMILTSTGEILTNNHVIDGATSITVTLVATGKAYPATVVGTDKTDDIAVLQIKGVSGLKTIQTSSAVAVGDSVVAIGNAGGVGGTPSVVTGSVVDVNQTISASDQGGGNAETLTGLIQIDAPIQAGDSGGPLVNTSSQVIGIDTAASSASRFRNGSTVGFAIPIGNAISIAKQIEAGKASSTIHIGLPGFIGVALSPSAGAGALVTGVQAGSPAATSGLVAGDTITSIDGKPVDSSQALTTLTKVHHPGDKVSIGWTDQSGAGHKANLTLATGPAD